MAPMLRRLSPLDSLAPVLLAFVLLACSQADRGAGSGEGPRELGRQEAIERAREHVGFEVRSAEAERGTDQGRPVWRITFRGRPPGEGQAMGEVVIVVLDRRTGELVSLAQS